MLKRPDILVDRASESIFGSSSHDNKRLHNILLYAYGLLDYFLLYCVLLILEVVQGHFHIHLVLWL